MKTFIEIAKRLKGCSISQVRQSICEYQRDGSLPRAISDRTIHGIDFKSLVA